MSTQERSVWSMSPAERERLLVELVGTSTFRWYLVRGIYYSSRLVLTACVLVVVWWLEYLMPRAVEVGATIAVLYWTMVFARQSERIREAALVREKLEASLKKHAIMMVGLWTGTLAFKMLLAQRRG